MNVFWTVAMPNSSLFVSPIIDSHIHYFLPEPGKHEWLMQPPSTENFLGDITSLCKPYLPQDLQRDFAKYKVEKIIYVQAGWQRSEDVLAEVRWLTELQDPLLGGVIAYANLTAPHIEEHLQVLAKNSLVKGIRQLIAWDKNPYYCSCEEDFLQNPIWRENFALLKKYSLRFDLQIFPEQTDQAISLLQGNPNIPVVIEHLLQPRKHDRDTLVEWEAQLAKLAALPQVCIKLSGAYLFEHAAKPEDVAWMIQTAVRLFGSDRCMFGSNFPVEKLYISYDEMIAHFWEATELLGEVAQADIFHRTARKFYL